VGDLVVGPLSKRVHGSKTVVQQVGNLRYDFVNGRALAGSRGIAGRIITFEIDIRFLTDFLQGDGYFKVHREGHDLDRCRTQFKLVESIEQQEEVVAALIESVQ
jgi:hypothetical protein